MTPDTSHNSPELAALKAQLDQKSAELVRTMLSNRGFTFLSGESLPNGEGFEHVAKLDDGSSTVVILTSRVSMADGACQLEFDSEGRMQFSPPWIEHILNQLPDDSPSKQAILTTDNLVTAIAGVDTVTNEFKFLKVDASEHTD